MSDDDPDHVEGVDFADVNPVLDEIEFPVASEALRERYGDVEIGRTNADPITVAELFEYMGDTTFESEEGLRTMIIGQMPRESGGRENYSDRGGSNPTTTEAAEDAEDQTAGDVEEGTATDPDTTQQ